MAAAFPPPFFADPQPVQPLKSAIDREMSAVLPVGKTSYQLRCLPPPKQRLLGPFQADLRLTQGEHKPKLKSDELDQQPLIVARQRTGPDPLDQGFTVFTTELDLLQGAFMEGGNGTSTQGKGSVMLRFDRIGFNHNFLAVKQAHQSNTLLTAMCPNGTAMLYPHIQLWGLPYQSAPTAVFTKGAECQLGTSVHG